MGNKARNRKRKAAARSREKRAALTCAEERERDAALIVARRAHRIAAKAVAIAFVKQHMPRPERMGAFCTAMKNDLVTHFSKEEGTTKVYEALWWMSYNCRMCGMGKWYCTCQPLSGTDEEVSDGDSWKTDGSEFSEGWETDTEDEEQQDEGLDTPGKKKSLPVSISPEDATATAKAAKRALFVRSK